MAGLLRAVHCLAQAPQQHRLYDSCDIITFGEAFDQDGVIACLRIIPSSQSQPQPGQKALQIGHSLHVRPIMVAINGIVPVMKLEIPCSAHVRGQHTFLDQPVRIISRPRCDPADSLVVIEFNERFGDSEINRLPTGAQSQI